MASYDINGSIFDTSKETVSMDNSFSEGLRAFNSILGNMNTNIKSLGEHTGKYFEISEKREQLKKYNDVNEKFLADLTKFEKANPDIDVTSAKYTRAVHELKSKYFAPIAFSDDGKINTFALKSLIDSSYKTSTALHNEQITAVGWENYQDSVKAKTQYDIAAAGKAVAETGSIDRANDSHDTAVSDAAQELAGALTTNITVGSPDTQFMLNGETFRVSSAINGLEKVSSTLQLKTGFTHEDLSNIRNGLVVVGIQNILKDDGAVKAHWFEWKKNLSKQQSESLYNYYLTNIKSRNHNGKAALSYETFSKNVYKQALLNIKNAYERDLPRKLRKTFTDIFTNFGVTKDTFNGNLREVLEKVKENETFKQFNNSFDYPNSTLTSFSTLTEILLGVFEVIPKDISKKVQTSNGYTTLEGASEKK